MVVAFFKIKNKTLIREMKKGSVVELVPLVSDNIFWKNLTKSIRFFKIIIAIIKNKQDLSKQMEVVILKIWIKLERII